MPVLMNKMVTGEDIIANVETEEGNYTETVFNDPAKLVIAPQGVGLMPWFPLAAEGQGEKITVKNVHIIAQVELPTEILNAYNEQYGSNIVIPDAATVRSLRIVTDE